MAWSGCKSLCHSPKALRRAGMRRLSGNIEKDESVSKRNNLLSGMFSLTPALSLNGEGVKRANRHDEETLKLCVRLSHSDTFNAAGIIERHESGSEWNNLLSGIFPLTQAP